MWHVRGTAEVHTGFRWGGGRRRIWENNMKMDLHEVGCRHGLDRFGSVQGQVAKACECGNECLGHIKCVKVLDCLRTC
jgi:hypothetical protein